MIQQRRAGLNISFKGGKVLRSFQTFHHNELHRINSFGLMVAGFYLAEVSRMTVWSRIKEMLYFVLISTSDCCGKIQMVVRKQTISSVPFPSNTGETRSQRKGFCAQHGDAFTMPWLRQAWPFHLLQPWAVQCGWNCKLLGTHCVSGTNTSWGGTLPSAAFSEEMKTERHWTLISLFSVSGEAQRLRVSQLDGIMGQVPGTALGRDAGTLLAWSGHLCAIAPGRAPTGPSRHLTAGQRGWSSQSLALALTPRCSAWDFVCRPIFMAPDVLCGFPSRWIICLLLLVSWAHKRVFLPPAAGKAWATQPISITLLLEPIWGLVAGTMLCLQGEPPWAQPATHSRFGCHRVCVSGPVREHCVFSCVCATRCDCGNWALKVRNLQLDHMCHVIPRSARGNHQQM